MSSHDAHAFLARVVSDTAFRQQFVSAGSPAAVMKKAKAAGYGFTVKTMKEAIKDDKVLGKMSPAQLDQIAGDTPGWIGGVSTGVGAAVGAGAAAAACV